MAVEILKVQGFQKITKAPSNACYDFVAEKDGKIWHIEVRGRTLNAKTRYFTFKKRKLELLRKLENVLLLLIRGKKYALIPLEKIKENYKTHISIEPILDFDLDHFVEWILDFNPSFGVSVGYDNYGCRLPEPPLAKTLQLIEQLEKHGIKVERKTLRKAWWEENDEG